MSEALDMVEFFKSTRFYGMMSYFLALSCTKI